MENKNNTSDMHEFIRELLAMQYSLDPPALRSVFQIKNNASKFYHHNAEACKALVQIKYPAECAVIESYHAIDQGKHPVSLTIDEFCVETIMQNLIRYYKEISN